MKLKPYLLLSLIIFMAGCDIFSQKTPAHGDKVNIIYIYADDLGYREIGPYGQKKINTPNLDKMAAQGMKFTQHYSGAPVCAPARCSLLTGKHTGHAYIRGNEELSNKYTDAAEKGQFPLAAGTLTIGTMLQNGGYKTASVGKWGLGMTGNTGQPNKQGFDYFYGYLDQKQAHNYYPTHLWENSSRTKLDNPYIFVHAQRAKARNRHQDALNDFAKSDLEPGDPGFFDAYKGNEYSTKLMTDKAEKFIRKNQHTPFFLYLPYNCPHVSLQVPDSAVNQYRGRFQEHPYFGQDGYAPHEFPLSAYAAMITYLDADVGKIFSLLKKLGLDRNTLVIFSSDNGTTFNGGVKSDFFNSVGGLRGLKTRLYEGGIRIPMIAWWPGKIKAGSVTDHISAQYDLMPTLADLAGLKKPKNTDGISFLPTLLGNPDKQKKHPFLYFEFPGQGGQIAVRMKKWKGVKTDLKQHPQNPWQLYDIKKDTYETTNVAESHPDILEKMDKIVKEQHTPSTLDKWNFVEQVIKASHH